MNERRRHDDCASEKKKSTGGGAPRRELIQNQEMSLFTYFRIEILAFNCIRVGFGLVV